MKRFWCMSQAMHYSIIVALISWSTCTTLAQVDENLAQQYFKDAAALCQREGGRIWGVSLCGPMIVVDITTNTMATNQPIPDAPRPKFFGYANTAAEWGDQRWSSFVWQMMPRDNLGARNRMMMHELFHRVQPQLGLLITNMPGNNDHLDKLEGRYWMQLEWRALAKSLASDGQESLPAVSDALCFRQARRNLFEGAAESERASEINEGLAQYTGTVTAYSTRDEAVADVIEQLKQSEDKETFVLTFAYASGAAYGLLLDISAPNWTRKLKVSDDLGRLLATSLGIQKLGNPDQAALAYGGAELWAAEKERDEVQKKRVAEYRSLFVEGPVLVLPRGRNAAFITLGVTPIAGSGTIYPSYRVSGPWGQIEADLILVSTDGNQLTVPTPFSAAEDGQTLSGTGWQLTLNPDWVTQPGPRQGDWMIVRKNP